MVVRRTAGLIGVALLFIAAQPAHSQYYGRPIGTYGYGGFYPYYGYNGFYSNGFSQYGPPVPTYGTVPGYFGGADQRLSNFNQYPPPPLRPRGPMKPLPPDLEGNVVDLPQGIDQSVLLEMRLPVSTAELFIDGQRTNQTGVLRTFRSPPLDKDKRYTYEIEARWQEDGKPISRLEKVVVEAGQQVRIDFRGMDPKE